MTGFNTLGRKQCKNRIYFLHTLELEFLANSHVNQHRVFQILCEYSCNKNLMKNGDLNKVKNSTLVLNFLQKMEKNCLQEFDTHY